MQRWAAKFNEAMVARDIDAAVALFADEPFWRDLLAFTWTIRTLEGRDAIAAMLRDRLKSVKPRAFKVEAAADGGADGDVEASEAWMHFDTDQGPCIGYVRLKEGRAATLFTALQDLADHPEPVGAHRPSGLDEAADGIENWRHRRDTRAAAMGVEEQPYVLVVGGGQGGLALAARLRVHGVPHLVIDRHARVGDQWRGRYASLTLHDPVWYDHMPYLPFPRNWPIYTPKDKLADFLESYAAIMEVDVWGDTELTRASHDGERWTVACARAGNPVTLRPTHLVMAVGNAGFPRRPDFPGSDRFAGAQLHSSEYSSGADHAGEDVVVIGANNSAHDICADLVAHGLRPTMVQRSSTLVLRGETNAEAARPLYSEEALARGLTTERADLLGASMPLRLVERHHKAAWDATRKKDADFYAALTDAGFALDFGVDGTGLFIKYLRTASGYYIDTGGSAMVADGRVALRSGSGVARLEERTVVLDDGTRLPADTVIYATGFGSMDQWVGRLISPAVADRIGPCWGYGSGVAGDPGPWEGELRNMWKPTAQEGLWFHGGNLQQSRFYSHYLALQLKARFLGVECAAYEAGGGERLVDGE